MTFNLNQLKRLREWRKLTQQDLSALSGVKLVSIQKQEQGVQKDTLLGIADPLARALGVPVEALYSALITDVLVNGGQEVSQFDCPENVVAMASA